MKSFGPQRIVVAILILVIAGYAGGLLMGGDSDDGAVSPLDSSDGGDQLVLMIGKRQSFDILRFGRPLHGENDGDIGLACRFFRAFNIALVDKGDRCVRHRFAQRI